MPHCHDMYNEVIDLWHLLARGWTSYVSLLGASRTSTTASAAVVVTAIQHKTMVLKSNMT
ncbi:hypothetical protein L208DRAFT_1410048 [Tricholoma matsutake]|nr:hypothetical protein L208DRAFT_1410048 [Tricholoma matsutake 945]